MKKSNNEITNKIKEYLEKSNLDFNLNYVMESNTHYVLYSYSNKKGKGNKCNTIKLDKGLI